jgi:hypothetical protein
VARVESELAAGKNESTQQLKAKNAELAERLEKVEIGMKEQQQQNNDDDAESATDQQQQQHLATRVAALEADAKLAQRPNRFILHAYFSK